MTKDHLVEEKTSLQKSLLYYESQHGRPVMLGFISNSVLVCIDSSNSDAIVRPEFNGGVWGSSFSFSKTQRYLLASMLPSEELAALTSKKRKKYVLIGPPFQKSAAYWSVQSDGCHLVPYLSVRQRDILKINKIIEFPGKRLEMLFWISQKWKWKDSSCPLSLQFSSFSFFPSHFCRTIVIARHTSFPPVLGPFFASFPWIF